MARLQGQAGLHMDVGDLVMFFSPGQPVFRTVQVDRQPYNQALTAMAGAERYFRMLDLAPSGPTRPPPPAAAVARSGRIRASPFRIRSRTARADRHLVSSPSRQTVALRRPDRQRQTTLVALLQKFYLPTRGVVRVD